MLAPSRIKRIIISAYLVSTLLICGAASAQRALERAYDAMARANQAQSALESFQTEGDPEKIAAKIREIETILAEARDAFQEAGYPESADLSELRTYIDLLRKTGDFDLAAKAVEHAITLSPKDGLLRVELGECYAVVGPEKREEAFKTLQESLDYELTDPYTARAYFKLGELYFEEGLFKFARESFEKVLELQPDAIRTKIYIAALDARIGKVAEASAALDKLGRDAQPFDIETRRLLRRALKDFDDQRRSFTDTAENHYAYSRLLYRAARIQEAIAAADHAARRNPRNINFLNFLGSIHMQLGNAGPAREAFERSLSIDPIQPNIRQSLATIPEN